MKILSEIYNLLFGKKEEAPYLSEFAIVDYSPEAIEQGLRGDNVKVIYKYIINEYGHREIVKLLYSKERVFALEKIHKIPVFDKTMTLPQSKLPIYATSLPMEVRYI